MASSGMIAGDDLKVEIGFLTYGCTLIGLSINLGSVESSIFQFSFIGFEYYCRESMLL